MLKTKKKSQKPVSKSQEDIDIESFAASIQYQEISFEGWQHSHSHLDLEIPLFLSPDEFSSGSEKIVNFCREITSSNGHKHRVKAEVMVQVPQGARIGDCFRFVGQGDQTLLLKGDVVIVLKKKS